MGTRGWGAHAQPQHPSHTALSARPHPPCCPHPSPRPLSQPSPSSLLSPPPPQPQSRSVPASPSSPLSPPTSGEQLNGENAFSPLYLWGFSMGKEGTGRDPGLRGTPGGEGMGKAYYILGVPQEFPAPLAHLWLLHDEPSCLQHPFHTELPSMTDESAHSSQLHCCFHLLKSQSAACSNTEGARCEVVCCKVSSGAAGSSVAGQSNRSRRQLGGLARGGTKQVQRRQYQAPASGGRKARTRWVHWWGWGSKGHRRAAAGLATAPPLHPPKGRPLTAGPCQTAPRQ